MQKIVLFITILWVLGAGYLLAQEVKAVGYDLGLMIDFEDNVTNKQIDKLIKKYSHYNLRKMRDKDQVYNDLSWFFYTDTYFTNKEFLNEIRNEDIVKAAGFTLTHYEQKAYEEKVQYRSRTLFVTFHDDVSKEQAEEILEKYKRFDTSVFDRYFSTPVARSVKFNTALIDEESFKAMIDNEKTVESSEYSNGDGETRMN